MNSNNLNGILLVNKEKGLTSRDVVNKICKEYHIKKVGHAGTLDPLATGLLVIGIGEGTKILELLTLDTKEYIATVRIGIQTDTYDITGSVVKELNNYTLTKEDLIKALNTFKKSYLQEVPLYSAVKVNGKKLYQYARNNEKIDLPKKIVEIKEIELLDYQEDEFTFKVLVSKGTYIRSLINDLGNYLNIPMTMKELIRTKSGKFSLNDLKFMNIQDSLDFKIIKIEQDDLLKKVKNGNPIYLNEKDRYLTLIDNKNKLLAIYEKKINFYRAYKMFINQ